LFASALLHAQVPKHALLRVFQIRVPGASASSFTIDHKGKQYLVTARHVVNGLPGKGADVEIRRSGRWEKLKVDILLPANPSVDIAVLVIPAPLSTEPDLPADPSKLYLGQDAYFLGFPREIFTRAGGDAVPFIKRATISANDVSTSTARIWYFDGFNNPGFSGGPIVYQSVDDKQWRIAAVVRGYLTDTAKQNVGGKLVDSSVLMNSGIIVAYDIRHAVEAINAVVK
jgi:S1-C subfamily serine protease